MKTSLALSLAVLLAALPAAAQDSAQYNNAQDSATTTPHANSNDSRTVEQKMPASVTNTVQDNVWTLNVENDLFTGQDSNYTSGVRLTYTDINSEIPGFVKYIAGYIPEFDINDTTSLSYSIGQNLYTPEDIESPIQDPDDRPWAAFLYTSVGLSTLTDNHTDEIELTLGVVGPAALGEESQKFIHEHISNSPEPQGWDNQLHTEPGIMVGWQRTWPQYMSGEVMGLFGSIAPYTGVTLGNIYTYGDVGVNFRLGPDSEKWQDTPVRVRPAMPGTGFFEIPADHWSWYLFAGIEGRAVARDIFLDGNTFRDSYSVDKNILVGDANAGLALTYGRTRVSFTWVYRTKEFDTQDDPETFGSVSVGYRF